MGKRTYRELKKELENLMEKLQDISTNLDEALVLHEKGKELLKELESYLMDVEKKVTKATKS